jgi:hypothetical protein
VPLRIEQRSLPQLAGAFAGKRRLRRDEQQAKGKQYKSHGGSPWRKAAILAAADYQEVASRRDCAWILAEMLARA